MIGLIFNLNVAQHLLLFNLVDEIVGRASKFDLCVIKTDNVVKNDNFTFIMFLFLGFFINTIAGKKIFLYEHYTYNKHMESKTGTRWKCSSKMSKNCNAFIVTNHHGKVVKMVNLHTHSPPNYHCVNGVYIKV